MPTFSLPNIAAPPGCREDSAHYSRVCLHDMSHQGGHLCPADNQIWAHRNTIAEKMLCMVVNELITIGSSVFVFASIYMIHELLIFLQLEEVLNKQKLSSDCI